jgi:hypothetical protein
MVGCLHTRRGRTLLVSSPHPSRRRLRRRRHGSRGLWGSGRILAAVEELDAAEAAMIQFAAHPPFVQVQKTCLHLVDFVAFFEFGNPVSTTTRTAATAAEMIPVPPKRGLFCLAFPAAVLRHEAEPLDECPMDPAQFAAAPSTFLLHLTVIAQFARKAQ